MEVIFGGILTGIGLIMFLARKEQAEEKLYKSKLQKPFVRAGFYLYKKILIISVNYPKYGRTFLELLHAPGVRKDLQILEPGENVQNLQSAYYVQKISMLLMFLFLGNMFAIFLSFHSRMDGMLADGMYIRRKAYGEGSIQKELFAEAKEHGWQKRIVLELGEQQYTEKELNQLYEEAALELKTMILGENERLSEITRPLYLPERLEGYPFSIEWESSDYELVDNNGFIQKETISPQGEPGKVKAVFSYYEYERECSFDFTVYSEPLQGQQAWEYELEKQTERKEAESRYDRLYELPPEAAGEEIIWREPKKNQGFMVFCLTISAALLIFVMQDKDLHKKTELRNQKMMLEYPTLISKLTLYLGAGMTVSGAWKKMALEYKERKKKTGIRNYAYEQMLLTSHEIDSGVSQSAAYEQFGKRCGLQPYMKLGTLLAQNLKKGNSTLVMQLREEAASALTERKNNARKAGEEAGTKLLLPMMLMLGIVMVLILIPAFLSFSV